MQNLQIIGKVHFLIIIIKHFLDYDIGRHRILVQGNVNDSLNVSNNKILHDVKPLFLKVTILWFLPEKVLQPLQWYLL